MFLRNVLLFAANLGWFVGSWQIGNKRPMGFVLNILSEALWGVYAIVAGALWGLGPWCLVGFFVYGRNLIKWNREKRCPT